MTDIAIRVRNISKRYHLYDAPHDRLKQFVAPRLQRLAGLTPRQYFREFWALKDISFEVKKGETVGIIGRNGSGKSTLLQIICGTLAPTDGAVETNGRVAALLELGSGFNPEFTGRENVYMSASILGLGKEEIDERFGEIAAFADIGEFIGQPVKTYSSGMYVRLAFAVNILSKPDIMIVDEALAVGDMNFQAKCMTALTRIQKSGTTVLFVSHDIGALKSLCSRGIYLEHGELHAIGKSSDVADRYIRTMREEMNAEYRQFVRTPQKFTEKPEAQDKIAEPPLKGGAAFKRSDEFDKRVAEFRYGSGGARIMYVELLNMDDEPIQFVEFDQEVKIRIFCAVETAMEISINFQVLDEKRNSITASGFSQANKELLSAEKGECFVVTYSLKLPLMEGVYSIQAHIAKPVRENVRPDYIDVVPNSVVFKVMCREPHKIWSPVYLFPDLYIEKAADSSC
jgi:lipopolysaccharide transport system ATP-binding protein